MLKISTVGPDELAATWGDQLGGFGVSQYKAASCTGSQFSIRTEDDELESYRLDDATMAVRLLVIEDDENLFESLARRLRRKNIELIWAKDGLEGIERSHELDFDAVLLDLGLPRMNGYHVLDELRNTYPELPVIIMTGNPDPELEDRLEPWAATSFLRKPFELDELIEAIDVAAG